MKRLTIFFALSCGFVALLKPAREWEQFLRANKLFEEGELQQALNEYEEITRKGPVLWYNIGICHYRQKNYQEALIALRRAERTADRKLFDKVAQRIQEVQDNLNRPHDSSFLLLAKRCAATVSLFWLQLFVLLLWWFYASCFFFNIKLSRFLKVAAFSLLVFGCTLMSLIWWVKLRQTGIMVKETNLFIGPNKDFHAVGTVQQGDEVILERCYETWCKVKTSSMSGWIERTSFESVEVDL